MTSLREDITATREDVAEMKGDIRFLVDTVREEREARKGLEAEQRADRVRIEALERKGIRVAAYAAGLSTAGGFVGGALLVHLKEKLLALFVPLMLVLGGCATASVCAGCDVKGHWKQRPVMLTLDSSMSSECKAAAEKAFWFWTAVIRDDYLQFEYREPSWVGFHGLTPDGHIAVHQGKLDPLTAGETASARRVADLSEITSADITLALCRPQTAAHELGHALGLWTEWGWHGHNPDPHYLMYYISSSSMALTAEEIQWVQW